MPYGIDACQCACFHDVYAYTEHTERMTTMAIPDYQSLMLPLMRLSADDAIHKFTDAVDTLADELNLSESRFLHLFKAEMNIAWRPYLLWRRLLCAINSLQRGLSATEAAHVAGFSDSAHLSRTFRNNFGMTIRQVTKKDWPDNN